LKRKVAPDNAKIEGLRQLGLAVSKDSDGETLQLRPEMTMKEIDLYLRNLFPPLFKHVDEIGQNPEEGFQWFLIVKSGKNMVRSGQEVLNGEDVLKTRHPASWKWTDQFIYFGESEIKCN
jgi:hypothetical protein